jgi:hypothetical protein
MLVKVNYFIFTTSEPDVNDFAFLQEKVDLGELMLSLCYLPTAGRLTMTVIKGRNFKAMDITGSSGELNECTITWPIKN